MKARPPAFSRWLLDWSSRRLRTPDLPADAEELFAENLHRHGARLARRWYRRQALACAARLLRPEQRSRGATVSAGTRVHTGASWLDVKLALRMLSRQPGLTFVAMFALAIGIPVGLLPLHVLDSLTKPLPVEDGENVVVVRYYDVVRSDPVMRPLHDYLQWREELSSFEALGIWRTDLFNLLTPDGRASPVRGAEVTGSIFPVLRVQPLLGRPLVESDQVIGAPDVVVVGYDLWRTRLSANPDVIGSTIRIGSVPHTVVGVMPSGFRFPFRDDLWLPFRHDALAYERGSGPSGVVTGRLAEGASIEDARLELAGLTQRMTSQFPDEFQQLRPQVLSFTGAMTEMDSPDARMGVLVAQILAFLLLALACGNVGILVLARAATRTRELAIRTALGASRSRIVTQLFIESLVLAVMAAGLGLLVLQAVATWSDDVRAGLPFWVDFDVTLRTALIALLLAAVSAAIAGVVPALKATGRSVQVSIQRASGGGSGIRFGTAYSALIVGEVAVSVWLLAIGSSLLPSAITEPHEAGIPAEQYLFASLRIPGVDEIENSEPSTALESRQQLARVHEELVRRLSAEPGAGPVAIASALPGMSTHTRAYIQVEGLPRAEDAPAPAHQVNVARVDVGFFDALGGTIQNGRNFNRGDLGADRSAVIVNTSFVERVLGGRNPIGRRLRYWAPGREPGSWSLEIVGVVDALGMNALNPEADQGLYHVVAPGELHPINFAVRVGSDPERFATRLRTLVAGIDADALIQDPVALDSVPNADRRVAMWTTYLLMLMAFIAILLAGACLYALMSFTVSERTHECGIRAALGAPPLNIVAQIAKRAFVQLSIGVAIGALLSAIMLSRSADIGAGAMARASSWPLTVAAIALLVIVVGMSACVRPTLRVLRIRPVDALRG